MTSERFEDELLEALSGEIEGQPEGPHLTTRNLRRLACGRTRLDELERLGAHFANCADCRARYDSVRRGPHLAEGGNGESRRLSLKRLLPRLIGIAAVIVAVAAVFLALRDRPPTLTGTSAPSVVARGTASSQVSTSTTSLSGLDPQTFVQAVHGFDGYPPSRAAAYTIGLLRQYGVPLSSSAIAFSAATVYVTEPGDTWESVAAKTLGDRALWPIVVLLNLELTKDGEFVPPSTYLRVPKTLSVTGGGE